MPGNSEFKEKTDKPNFKPIGMSGTVVTSNQIDDEYLSELKNIAGQVIYERMLRSDSQIRKLFTAVSNPIRSAKWDIEPASDLPKDLEIAALIKHIIFTNCPGGWEGKLDEIITFPWHGHAVFEVIHANRTDKAFGPYTGLDNIAFRDQRTLDEWKFKDGKLIAIHQKQGGDLEIDVDLPLEFLMIFYNEKKGDDKGFPFLRMLYGNYKRKLLYKQLQAIGIERSALPVPILSLPHGLDATSEQYTAAQLQLAAFTLAETSYFMVPHGYKLELGQANTFDPSKTQVAIKAENEEIVGALVAMFLEMGIGGNSGNQAGTSTSADFFTKGLLYLANKIATPFNIELIPQLVRMNFGDVEIMPKLVHSGISEDAGKELMEIITGYANANVIVPDEALEDHVRKAHNLPKKVEGTMLDNKKSQGTVPEADDEDETQLSDKTKPGNVKALMSNQAKKISEVIRNSLEFSGNKFISDTMNKYKNLSEGKKQDATSLVTVGGTKKFKDALKAPLAESASLAISMARKEVPSKKDVELKSSENDMILLSEKYGDFSEIRLMEKSQLPAYIQVLISKQADLISTAAMNEMISKLSFTYASIELKSKDINVIKQNMEETLSDFIKSPQVVIKGENVSALMVNESRNSFFFNDDVMEDVHSFTFMNAAPQADICKELAGTTFNTNDAESLRYTPPLHHNCKSYLRANLKTSRGIEKLEVSTLAPSAKAIKSMTL